MPDNKTISNAPSALTMLFWLLTAPDKLGIGEDPDWGNPTNQLRLQSAIHDLAGKLSDKATQKAVQTATAKGMELSVRALNR